MRCQVFELAVVDLARGGESLDDRGEALAHAEACERCRARLAAERALSTELRTLAVADAGLEAPARTEADLRAAFRSLAAPPAVARRRPRFAPLAIAAGVATLLGGALVYRAAIGPRGVVRPVDPHPTAGLGQPTTPHEPVAPAPQPQPRPPVWRASDRGVRKPSRAAAAPRPASPTDTAPREIATEYYSLVGGEVIPRDGWQIVRVEVPRASLGALGFAVNPARAGEPITADVMLGHDGVARAIRFVQTTDSSERRYR